MNRRLTIVSFFLMSALASSLPAAIQGVVMTAEGKPVENASVSAMAPESSTANRERLQSGKFEPELITAVTDRAGKFTIDAKTQAVVRLLITAPGYSPRGVIASGNDDLGAIPLTAAAMKKGTVTAGGKPVPGAIVIWSGVDRFELASKTDEKGEYSVPDPEKWATSVFVFHPDYAKSQSNGLRVKLPLDQRLDRGIEVTGTVTGADGKSPVAGATIYVDEWKSAESAADGTFTVHHAASQWDEIRASKGDQAGAITRSGTTRSIRLGPAAQVAGVVSDGKTATGLAGVLVRMFEGQPRAAGRSEVTDSKGRYAFTGLVPGDFGLDSSAPNFEDASARLTVAAGDKLQKSFALVKTATVIGDVIDEGKRPVAAAMLRASADEQPRFQRMQRPGPLSYSGPDGRFVIREVHPNEELGIEARKKGQPSARAASQKFSPGERKTGVVITLPLGIAVTGRVTDRDGNPIAGVAVDSAPATDRRGAGRRLIFAGARDSEDRPQTDREGNFEIRLKEGRYDLTFSHPGFAPGSVPAVSVSSNSKPLTVVLDPGAEVSGRVVRADGTGVADVRLDVFGESSGNTVTAPDGSFVISDLAAGPMMLMAVKPDDFISERRSVSAPASNVTIEVPAGGIISGRVIDKATKEPVTSFRAGPSSSRRGGGMQFVGPRMQQSFRSEDGTFVLNNVPAGQTQLVVDAPGYVTATISGLTVDPDKPVRDLEVSLETGLKLSGKVTGADGTGLQGANVIEASDDPAGMGRRGGTSTDSDGTYSVDGLESGEHTFAFSKSGYVSERKTLKLSAKDTSLDVRLAHGTEVHGVVVDQSGAPVSEAQVVARGAVEGAGYNQARTDANGTFQFEGLTPGRYSFRADKSGYVSGSADDIDIQSSPSVRIALKGGGVVFGTVSGFNPEEAARVNVRASSGREGGTSRIDSSGAFRIEGVPAGAVTVTASIASMAGGRSTSPKTIELTDGGSAQVDLQFNNDTVVEGRVTQLGKPLGGRMVA
ncbi:MAG: carboxypeptidase-like regulatory domain-containing protein, partial [Acidobacteriota bacterium]